MRAEYRKDLMHSYLILGESGNQKADLFRLKILLSNRIRCLLPLTVEHINGEERYCFDITGLQAFASCCEYACPDAAELRLLYANLLDSLSELEDYLLDPGQLILDPEYLYTNWDKKELFMPYLPEGKGDLFEKMAGLTEYLLAKTGHTDQNSVVLLCRILHELKKPNAHLSDLKSVINKGAFDNRQEAETERQNEEIFLSTPEGKEETYRSLMTEDHISLPDIDDEPDVSTISSTHRSFLPDRDTLLSAAGMCASAAVVWLILNLQTRYRLSVTQTAGFCMLGASFFLLIVLMVIRKRNDRIAYEQAAIREYEQAAIREEGMPDENQSFNEPIGDFAKRIGVSDYFAGEGIAVEWETPAVIEPSGEENHDGETVLLSDYSPGGSGFPPSMTPASPESGLRPFTIGSDDILIGHKANLVDRVIADSTVSRIHARIFRRGGVYYVCDMGSKNGTSVDGKQIVGREEVPLSDGSHVCFARCEYVFHEGLN